MLASLIMRLLCGCVGWAKGECVMERPSPSGRSEEPAAGTSGAARGVCAGLATYALAGSLISLIGWATHLPRLTGWDGGDHHMFANTALAAVCAATALLLLSRRLVTRPPRIAVILL